MSIQNNKWQVGGNEIHGYFISRPIRPMANDSAWVCITHPFDKNQVKIFQKRETAEKLAIKLNKNH